MMIRSDEEIDRLKQALAIAEAERDAARADAATVERRWMEERRAAKHNLRNMFSIIRVIARQTGDEVDNVDDYRALLGGRLSSYLTVQAAIAQEWYRGTDLALLVAGELLGFGVKEGDGIALSGPAVMLTGRAAGFMALAFHELAYRAALSGRLATPSGRLRVDWSLEGGDDASTLRIAWVESSMLRHPSADVRPNWAPWLEQAITHQLAGKMHRDVTRDGHSVGFTLPGDCLV